MGELGSYSRTAEGRDMTGLVPLNVISLVFSGKRMESIQA